MERFMTLTSIHWRLALGLSLAAAAIFPAGAGAQTPAAAQASANNGGIPVRMTVTATSKEKNQQPPALAQQDFLVYEGKDRRPILNVVPQTGADDKLDLYIVVDDSIDTAVSLNYPDVGKFVRELPTPVRVGVVYTANGTVQVAQ